MQKSTNLMTFYTKIIGKVIIKTKRKIYSTFGNFLQAKMPYYSVLCLAFIYFPRDIIGFDKIHP